MYKELKALINILGKEHFLIYVDGDVEYIYIQKKIIINKKKFY